MTRNKIYLIAIVFIVCLISYIGLLFFLQSRPKVTVVLATNQWTSGWFNYGTGTKDFLEKHGFNLKNVETKGSRENFELLDDPKSAVNAALILRSVLDVDETNDIVSLGAVGIEPIWIFYRSSSNTPPASLRDISNLSVLVAPSGSGSYALTKKLFDGVGIEIENNKNFSSGSFSIHLNDFLAGKGDVFIFTSRLDDNNTRRLLFDPLIKIYELESNTDFYQKTGLNEITLPKGSINEVHNIPDQDIRLVATYHLLAVKKDLPAEAQIALLLAARSLIPSHPYVLPFQYTEYRSNLPAPMHNSEIKMSKAAMRFYKEGPPFLTQFFPEWLGYCF